MSSENPDRHRQARKMPGFTLSHSVLPRESPRRGLSTFTLAMLNGLVDELLEMDPPPRGYQPAASGD